MAKKSAKKYSTENKAIYAKEIYNLKRRIRDAEKKGYRFEQEFKDSLDTTPDRIGKPLIKKIHDIRREELYKHAEYELEDGIKISGERAFKDRFRTKEKREFEYQDETKNEIEEVDIGTYYDYGQEDYLSEEAIEKDAYDILTERIEGLNWINEDEKDYLLRVVGDEYGDYGKPDYKIWADEEWLAEGLPELVIDSPKRKHVLSMIHTNTGGKTSGENVDKVARLFYALSTLRGSENNLTERDYEFLHRYGE